jgi:penicillin amidase
VPLVREYLPADLAPGFASWDGRASEGSHEYLVARAVRRAFRENALAAWHVPDFRRFMDEEPWLELAASDDAAFRRAGLGPKETFVKKAVADALAGLERRYGKREHWTWGDVNRLAVHHPLGRIPGLAWLFDPPSGRQSGSPTSVKASSPAYGQSMRFIVDWGDPAATTLVIPFGVSGHLGSPNRSDQLQAWLHGDPGGKATRLAKPPQGAPLEFR